MGETATIRFAQPDDLAELSRLDRHLEESALSRKIARREILVAETAAGIVGLLRYNLLWDLIPFMNLITVLEAHRLKGIGKALVLAWEKGMADLGYKAVMTSTQADESGQHFHRKLGYVDVGGFVLPSEPLEIVMWKKI